MSACTLPLLVERRSSHYSCSCSNIVASQAFQIPVRTRVSPQAWACFRKQVLPQKSSVWRGKPSLTCQAAFASSAKAPTAISRVLQQAFSGGVLESTVGATAKLFLVCGFVGWLLHSGRLTDDTAPLLSKVAFNMMLPCMLFSSVASTLANNYQWSMLAIPALALIQILIGAVGGRIATRLIVGAKQTKTGWHPLNPAKSANTIAASTAQASRLPHASDALLPSSDSSPRGTRELISTACVFGNSFTLPSVFMMSLLSAAAFQRATGYTALFLVSWSPCLWSYGYKVLSSAAGPHPRDLESPLHTFDEADMETAQMALMVDPEKKARAEGAALQGQLTLRRQVSALRRQLEKLFNPPLVGIVAGIAVGLSPLGKPLFTPETQAAAALAGIPIELNICLGILKLGIEVLKLLAGGTLALQTVVLAASLFQKIPEEKAESAQSFKPAFALPVGQSYDASNMTGLTQSQLRLPSQTSKQPSSRPDQGWKKGRSEEQLDGLPPAAAALPGAKPAGKRPGQNLLNIIVPKTSLEWKMLLGISLVRFMLVPGCTLAVVAGFQSLGWLPADPVCRLAILIQAAMPSAQNLALVVNLQENTRFLAPRLAKMLLQLYVIAVVPVTLWVAIFVGGLGIPLSTL